MYHKFIPLLQASIPPRSTWVYRLRSVPLCCPILLRVHYVPEFPSLPRAYPSMGPTHDPRQGYVYLMVPSPLRVSGTRSLTPGGGLYLSPSGMTM